MEKLDGVVVFSVFLAVLIIAMVIAFFFHERRKKKETVRRFRAFRNGHNLSQKDLRAVPRISVPESLDVILILKQNRKILRANVADISLSGLSVIPYFSLKKMILNGISTDARIDTAINRFYIKALKLVRKERKPGGRFMAFHIHDIEEHQFEELKSFLKYLDGFLAHEQNKN
jgi:hypothetical protein